MAAPPALPSDQVRPALERIAASESFRSAGRLSDLLRYIVEAGLNAPGQPLKEYEIGSVALGRGDKFDPRYDPIVRAEMSRLRSRLSQYYANEGAADPVRIAVPKGSYAPVFCAASVAASVEDKSAGITAQHAVTLWAAVGIAVMSAAIAAVVVFFPRTSPSGAASAVTDATLGVPGFLDNVLLNPLAVSPDGRMLAIGVRGPGVASHLYIRPLDSLEGRELPGTVGGYGPFFSPDGQWVAFGANGKLKKTRTDGTGSPVLLAGDPELIGGAWMDNGQIIGTSLLRSVLVSVPETGGPLAVWLDASGAGDSLLWSSPLPRGRGVLVQVVSANGDSHIEAITLDKKRKTIVTSGAYPRFAAGSLFYVDRGALLAVKFDPDRLEMVGSPETIARNIGFSLSGGSTSIGAAWYGVGGDGVLVFSRNATPSQKIIARLGQDGSVKPLTSTPGDYVTPRLSPDGRRIAYGVVYGQQIRLETLDLSTGVRQRITPQDTSEADPAWSPDGKYLFSSQPNGDLGRLIWRDAGAVDGEAHLLLASGDAPALTADGRQLVFHNVDDPASHFDVWTAAITYGPDGPKAGEPRPVLRSPGLDLFPNPSPDGRWVAFTSMETDGNPYLYASALDATAGAAKTKISSASGGPVVWSPVRLEIFYHGAPDATLMVQPLSNKGGALSAAGPPRRWTDHKIVQNGMAANFDVSRDGHYVVGVLPAADDVQPADRMIVVTNVLSRTGPPL